MWLFYQWSPDAGSQQSRLFPWRCTGGQPRGRIREGCNAATFTAFGAWCFGEQVEFLGYVSVFGADADVFGASPGLAATALS